jgi:hypothetical protein
MANLFDTVVGNDQKELPVSESKPTSSTSSNIFDQVASGSSMVSEPMVTSEVKPTQKMNWAGTGPELSVGEYFASGFGGRIVTGIAERTGLKDKVSTKSLSDLITNPEEPPIPSVSESFKQFKDFAMENPWEAAKGVVYELGKDPELLYPGLWEYTPAKVASALTKVTASVAKVSPILSKTIPIVTTGTRGAAMGAGLETAAQAAESEDYRPQAIKNTAAMFGAFAGGTKAIGTVYKGIKEAIPSAKPSLNIFDNIVKETPDFTIDSEGTVKSSVEQPIKETPQNKVILDTINNDILKEETVDPITSDFKLIDTVKDTIRNIKAKIRLADVWENQIKSAIPEEQIRNRVTMAMEKEKAYDKIYTDSEKIEVLGEQKTALNFMKQRLTNEKATWPHPTTGELYNSYLERANKLEFVIKRLESLPSEEHAIPIMDAIKTRIENIGKEAQSLGIVDFLRNNYVSHILDFKGNKLNAQDTRALLDKIFNSPKESKFNRDFSEHRTFETIRELEKTIPKNSGIKVQKDIAKIASIYEKSMQTAILHKKMIDHFTTLTDEKGIPYMSKDPTVIYENKFQRFEGKGSEPIKDYGVHPDLVDSLNFIFRQKDPGAVTKMLSSVNYLTKSLNVVGSLFHAYSLAQAQFTAAPGNFVKQVFTKFGGIKEAIREYHEGGLKDSTDLFIKNGLNIGTEDIHRTIVSDIGMEVDRVINKVMPEYKVAQRLTDPLDKYIIGSMNKFTWDYAHTGGKLQLAHHFFNKIKLKNPEMPDAQIAKEVSSFINNTLGGLDWLEVASQVNNKFLRGLALKTLNIRGRDWAQLMLFAPDWTVSTLRAFTNALPNELMKPKNWELREGVKGLWNPKKQSDLARRYVLNTALLYLTILNGFNMAFTGRPVWTNKDPTRVDLGDGTSIQMAKHSMEAAEWAMHPDKTLANKLGFWPKSTIIALTGKAYVSPTAPNLQAIETPLGKSMALSKAAAIGKQALPFAVGSALNAPSGERAKRAIVSSLGIPIYGQKERQYQSPEQRLKSAKSRRESLVETRKRKLEEFNKKN